MTTTRSVLVVDLSLSIHSIRVLEAYQVSVSYPLVPPSTILGAIARSLSTLGLCGSGGKDWVSVINQCYEKARDLVNKARDTSVLLKDGGGPISIKQPVILRVVRGILEEKRLPKDLDEVRGFSDAMVREFVLTYPRPILVIPRGDEAIKDLYRSLWHLYRFGNSESYVSISSVKKLEAYECDKKEINVVAKYTSDLIEGGNYTLMSGLDEYGRKVMLALPVSSSTRGDIYYPSTIRVKGKTMCVNNDGKYIVFPAGDDW